MLISRMGIDKQIIKMDLMPRMKAPLGFRELSESLKRGANFLFTLVCVSSKEDVQSFFYQFSYRFIIPRSGTTASLKSMKKARSVEKPLLSTALVRSRKGLIGGRAQHTGPGQTQPAVPRAHSAQMLPSAASLHITRMTSIVLLICQLCVWLNAAETWPGTASISHLTRGPGCVPGPG